VFDARGEYAAMKRSRNRSSLLGKSLGKVATIAAVLVGAVVSFAATGSAEAQYYPPQRDGYYREAPPPGYYRERRRYMPPQEQYYSRPQRVPMGMGCVTSRGTCQYGPVAIGQGCKCYIPGFGMKRGHVQF
jgi:hypothetical protein